MKLGYEDFKNTITKEELEELYTNYSVKQIAYMLNVKNEKIVSKVMKEFGIEVLRNGSSGKANDYNELMNIVNYDDLYKYYITEHHSIKECAEHFELSGKVMYKLIRLYNIRKSLEDKTLTEQRVKEEKYGDPFYNNSKQISISYKNTYLENGEDIIKKRKATKLEKYGDENYTGEGGFYHCKYDDNDVSFDSLPELALWKYAIDHDEDIEREPVVLKFEFNGVSHTYKPDFKYNGELIEIKGDHMVNKDGILFDVWSNHKNDDFYKAKYDCAISNGVRFILSEGYNKFLDYFNSRYNKEDFIRKEVIA